MLRMLMWIAMSSIKYTSEEQQQQQQQQKE
jgi:hypothetical protein